MVWFGHDLELLECLLWLPVRDIVCARVVASHTLPKSALRSALLLHLLNEEGPQSYSALKSMTMVFPQTGRDACTMCSTIVTSLRLFGSHRDVPRLECCKIKFILHALKTIGMVAASDSNVLAGVWSWLSDYHSLSNQLPFSGLAMCCMLEALPNLVHTYDPACAILLQECLQEPDLRALALRQLLALQFHLDAEMLQLVLEFIGDEDEDIRTAVMHAMRQVNMQNMGVTLSSSTWWQAALAQMLHMVAMDESPDVQVAAASALRVIGARGDYVIIQALSRAVADPDGSVRDEVCKSLLAHTKSENTLDVVVAVARTLSGMGKPAPHCQSRAGVELLTSLVENQEGADKSNALAVALDVTVDMFARLCSDEVQLNPWDDELDLFLSKFILLTSVQSLVVQIPASTPWTCSIHLELGLVQWINIMQDVVSQAAEIELREIAEFVLEELQVVALN